MTEKENLYRKAIDCFGVDAQIDMLIEEMSELTKALLKYRRKQKFTNDNLDIARYNIIEEIADVKITLEQSMTMFNCREKVDEIEGDKLERLSNLVKYHNQMKSIRQAGYHNGLMNVQGVSYVSKDANIEYQKGYVKGQKERAKLRGNKSQ